MRLRELFFENLDRTGESKSAVVGYGRGMGHKGHMFLASSVLTQANESGSDPYFVISRTMGKDDPLSPEEKLQIYNKVFPNNPQVFRTATEEMPDLNRVLKKLATMGYSDVTVVVGADQVNAFQYLVRPDKSGVEPYKQFGLENMKVIARQDTNDPSREEEGPRATPMRQALVDPNMNDQEKFDIWRDAMSPQLSDQEVRDLMATALQRMQDFSKPKVRAKKEKAVAEGGEKYKVKSIGHDAKGDYYISPSTGKKVYKSGVKVGDHENPKTGEHKGVVEGGMPSSVIKSKQRYGDMSDKDFAELHQSKADDDLVAMAWRHGYGKGSLHYVNKRKRGKEGVTESKNRCSQCGMTNCSCAPGKCKCKPIAGWIPNKGFEKDVEEGIMSFLAKPAATAISKAPTVAKSSDIPPDIMMLVQKIKNNVQLRPDELSKLKTFKVTRDMYKTDKSVGEEAAGVGIVTKQNSTADVGPGTLRKNLKAFNLTK